jgi:hypothetical protein
MQKFRNGGGGGGGAGGNVVGARGGRGSKVCEDSEGRGSMSARWEKIRTNASLLSSNSRNAQVEKSGECVREKLVVLVRFETVILFAP